MLTNFNSDISSKLVSIIIPCYNTSNYIGDCIESILRQTYKEWEAFVIDDCSSDESVKIASEFFKKESRINLIQLNKNVGSAAARNIGIRESKGNFIAFIDADDMWLPKKLEIQVEFLLRNPKVGLVATDGFVVDAHSNVLRRAISQKKVKRGLISAEEFLLGSVPIATSSVMLRRECLERVGLFHEEYRVTQDFNLWYRISREFHIDIIEEPLFYYRIHQANTSANRLKTKACKIAMFESEILNDKALVHEIGHKLYVKLQKLYWGMGKLLYKNGDLMLAHEHFRKAVSVGIKNYTYLKSLLMLGWMSIKHRKK